MGWKILLLFNNSDLRAKFFIYVVKVGEMMRIKQQHSQRNIFPTNNNNLQLGQAVATCFANQSATRPTSIIIIIIILIKLAIQE